MALSRPCGHTSVPTQARVLYIGTEQVFVSLRLAYAVMPEELVEAAANFARNWTGSRRPRGKWP
jgi:hypothetical protein